MESKISTRDSQRTGENKRQKKSQLRQTEHSNPSLLVLAPPWHSRCRRHSSYIRKKILLWLLFFMNSFLPTDQRSLQWPLLSLLTLILSQAQVTWQMLGHCHQRMLNKLLASLCFHLLPQAWETAIVISVCQHLSELGGCSISSDMRKAIIKIEKSYMNSGHGNFPRTWRWQQEDGSEFEVPGNQWYLAPPPKKRKKKVFLPQTVPFWWKWSAVTLNYSLVTASACRRQVSFSFAV